jgi:hypothetical protein
VRATGKPAVIGSLDDIDRLVTFKAGTSVTLDADGLEFGSDLEATAGAAA